jgi:predicted NAD-dependent protein-ADP-ribosyltransferase YbiA (DUF1768 family)
MSMSNQSNQKYFKTLPEKLPDTEPYYYLSKQQLPICLKHEMLGSYVPLLPVWVPHRIVSVALGYGEVGINNALQRSPTQRPYVWATEFENVHSTWNFEEPHIIVDNVLYMGSEHYYQAQKPYPFNSKLWDSQRDDVMRQAVFHKFTKNTELKELLLSTHHHLLLSIKRDSYWGVLPNGHGENKLGELLMELRAQLTT